MNSVTVDHIYLNREWSICFVVTRMKRATTRGTTPPPSPAPRPRTPTTATALDVMVPCCTHWKTPTRTCMTRSWNRWTRVYARVVFSNEWLVWFSKAEVDLKENLRSVNTCWHSWMFLRFGTRTCMCVCAGIYLEDSLVDQRKSIDSEVVSEVL